MEREYFKLGRSWEYYVSRRGKSKDPEYIAETKRLRWDLIVEIGAVIKIFGIKETAELLSISENTVSRIKRELGI